jgi:DNA-binding MarR family transcriptional regulator
VIYLQERSEAENVSENLIKAFVQFRRLKMDEGSSDPNHTHHCLKHSEIMLLHEIKEAEDKYPDGISISDISRTLRVKPPSITSIITGLEQKNMVERTMDINDRRIIRVKITEEGNQFVEKNRQHMIEKVKGLVDYLGTEKSAALASLIDEVFTYVSSKAKK